MPKQKQICLISFLALLAIGVFVISGQSQAPTAPRASGFGFRKPVTSQARQSPHRSKGRSKQQLEAVTLTYGLVDFPRSPASNAFGLNSKGDIVGGYGPPAPPPHIILRPPAIGSRKTVIAPSLIQAQLIQLHTVSMTRE
jgi:hypothetical protein